MARHFIFVDESGDPAPLREDGRNWYFACIALETTQESLPFLVDCFVEARYHRLHTAELRSLDKDTRYRGRLVELFACCIGRDDVHCSLTWLDKRRYTGPYLDGRGGESVRFRNFQLRRLLEWHFALHPRREGAEYELVVDRYQHSQSQVDNLRDYLANNWSLPSFAAVTAADSRYVEGIQAADLLLDLWRAATIPSDPAGARGFASLDLSFVPACDVSVMSPQWRPPV